MSTIKSIFGRCKGGILAAAAACFITLVYGPLELYFTNREDFWFAPNVIVPEVLFLFAAALLLCILLLAAADRWAPKLYTLLTGCFVWGTLVCYLHSNFLSGWLPSMNGSAVDWNAYPTQRALSAAVCVAAALFVGFLGWKKWLQNAAFFGGGAVTLMLAITVTAIGISSTSTAGSYYVSTTQGLQTYSTDKNFVIFVVDSVDGDVFEQLVNENPEYRESLQDFTYYRNTLSAYPYTYYAVTQMLTGAWYEGGEDFETFRSRAVRESPLFQTLQEQNYQMGIYFTENLVDKNAEPERFFNMRWGAPDIVSHPAFWRVILRMSCVKNAPFDFKRLGYSLPEKLNGLKLIDKDQADADFTVSNRDFLSSCQKADTVLNTSAENTSCENKMFKYIHVEGAHTPLQYGPHMEDLSGTEQATYQNQVAGTIYLIQNYLDMLRHNGSYDNTAVIIMSDHGYEVTPGAKNLEEEKMQSARRGHSIFLAKGFGEKHAFAMSEAPLSYEDLQQVYTKLLQGSTSENLIEWQKGETRQRRYLNYQQENLSKNGFEELLQTGYADDMATLQPSGRQYFVNKGILQ